MATEPEQATIADVFRLVNTMREEVRIGLGTISQEMGEGFEKAAQERQAIRDVVDTLPTFDQVTTLETLTAELKAEVHRLRTEQARVTGELRRAGVRV